jgi:hypothetical protein
VLWRARLKIRRGGLRRHVFAWSRTAARTMRLRLLAGRLVGRARLRALRAALLVWAGAVAEGGGDVACVVTIVGTRLATVWARRGG